MKTKKQIDKAIETMKKLGRESKNDIEKKILVEKIGVLTWVLKDR